MKFYSPNYGQFHQLMFMNLHPTVQKVFFLHIPISVSQTTPLIQGYKLHPLNPVHKQYGGDSKLEIVLITMIIVVFLFWMHAYSGLSKNFHEIRTSMGLELPTSRIIRTSMKD